MNVLGVWVPEWTLVVVAVLVALVAFNLWLGQRR
jgi:hypothetical protein